jgi:hypothetical protein
METEDAENEVLEGSRVGERVRGREERWIWVDWLGERRACRCSIVERIDGARALEWYVGRVEGAMFVCSKFQYGKSESPACIRNVCKDRLSEWTIESAVH